MNKRIFLIVLDSFGVGECPDSYKFGDEGSNTFRSCYNTNLLHLPNMKKLGLFNVDGVDFGKKSKAILGSYGKMEELSKSKDSTAGHWEIADLITEIPFPTYPNGFPKNIIKQIEQVTKRKVVCNKTYSGTEVIKDYYKDAMKGKLIVYTSADSVLQIAAHESVIPLNELYKICEQVRNIMVGDNCVARIIARPFTGEYPNLTRTPNRHDYSVEPTGETMLDRLIKNDKTIISIGKISSLFNNRGISEQISISNNLDGIKHIIDIVKNRKFNGLCFANLVDFDSKYGHRNNPIGYAEALNEFDRYLSQIINNMKTTDTLIITADHGCDPATPSTDHSREYVPVLMYGNKIKANTNIGCVKGFNYISKIVEKILK